MVTNGELNSSMEAHYRRKETTASHECVTGGWGDHENREILICISKIRIGFSKWDEGQNHSDRQKQGRKIQVDNFDLIFQKWRGGAVACLRTSGNCMGNCGSRILPAEERTLLTKKIMRLELGLPSISRERGFLRDSGRKG